MAKRKKIRIHIDNPSTLSSIADLSLSRWGVAFLIAGIFLIAILIAAVIVMVTPLHTLLPGYLKENQRSATEENLLRLDSLHNVYDVNQRYIDNYLRIMDTHHTPADSSMLHIDTVKATATTLLSPSERERKFVAEMEEREKFNISVLAPLAADGMTFSNISDTGIFSSESKDSEVGEVILPQEGTVLSVADGTVIASYYSRPEQGYVIVLQHPRGFVSRYSHTGEPLVTMGEEVNVGQIISAPPYPDSSGKRTVYIRMWHQGNPVIPYKLIKAVAAEKEKNSFGSENLYEAPRGR